jgi:hypothetical protein
MGMMNNRDSIVQLREIIEWIKEIDTGNENYNYKLTKAHQFIEDIIIDMVYDKLDNGSE